MNAKMQTPRNPKIRLAAIKGFKGVFGAVRLRSATKYSRPPPALPSQGARRRGRERP